MHRLGLALLASLLLIPAGQALAQSEIAAAPVATSQEAQARSQGVAIPAQADPTQTGTDTTPTDTGTDTTPTDNTDDPDEEEFGEEVEDQATVPEEQPAPAPPAPPPPAPAPAPELPRTGSNPAVLIAALSLLLLGVAVRRVTRPS